MVKVLLKVLHFRGVQNDFVLNILTNLYFLFSITKYFIKNKYNFRRTQNLFSYLNRKIIQTDTLEKCCLFR